MDVRSLFTCGALILFSSVAYAGSYERTKDGQTLVWRDVPSRGDEATWSGKRDKDGFATGSGVLTWYKVQPAIVTGSNILDTRRYVVSISHYSGEMARGKFKGAVTYVSANGRALDETSGKRANRSSRRQKGNQSASRVARAMPKPEKTPTPSRRRIVVDTPELTSAPTTPSPAAEQTPSPDVQEPQTAEPPDTAGAAAEPTATPTEIAAEESPPSITEGQQTEAPSETGALVAEQMATPPQRVPEQGPSPVAPEAQIAEPPQTDTVTTNQSATPAEQQAMQLARNTTARTPNRSDDSVQSRAAQPNEIPKPPPTIDEETVARLDTLYHSAVKANDSAIMDEILADDFVLVTDDGTSLTKADLIKEAQNKRTTYEHQEIEKGTQKVRIWRDTAVVTALLNIKGTRDQDSFDYKVSVSETYVRTPTGWRYVFGQASKTPAQ